MSGTVFKYSMKTTQGFFWAIAVSVAAMIVSIAWLFPTLSQNGTYSDLLLSIPADLRSALGVSEGQGDLNSFLNSNYYNSVHLYMMMAFSIILVSRLVSKPIDDTSLSYFLNGKLTRTRYLTTQITVFVALSFLLSAISVASGVVGYMGFASTFEFDLEAFVASNVSIMTIFIALGAACLLVRTLSTSGTAALAISSVFVIGQYLVFMVRSLSPDLDWLKYLTVFSLYDPPRLTFSDSFFWAVNISLLLASVALFAAATVAFRRRDLNL
ncbi:hypothetical protein ACTXJX_13305 [Glutamicibacter ardleyensis]|uniref:hypothetical protein n=1 Tax=Glutamicibacter ardleyensis TaxID=225894 RepID=UPI003FD490A2